MVYDDLVKCYEYVVSKSDLEFELTPDTESILLLTAAWLQDGKRGLLLLGNCGTGKSKLMQALSLLFEYYENGRNKLRIYSANEIVKLSLIDAKDYHAFELIKTANYVGIDDLGTEPVMVKNWGNEQSPIIEILFARYNAMKCTVLSTNLTLAAFINSEGETIRGIKEIYGDRIYDRICEQYDSIVFDFKSFRQ